MIMADSSEVNTVQPATAEDLTEVMAELEQYRDRLVNETLENAKKAKLMKTVVMAQLEPELAKIDAMLQDLRDRLAALTANN
jgi:capsule polysaccharide export protein KpsE/RkpR